MSPTKGSITMNQRIGSEVVKQNGRISKLIPTQEAYKSEVMKRN